MQILNLIGMIKFVHVAFTPPPPPPPAPFFRGTDIRPHKVDSQIIVTARMQFGKFCSLFIIYMNLHRSFKPLT